MWPRKCLDCGADVEFNGQDEVNYGFGPCRKHPGKHRVANVAYYHSGARDIQDQRDRRKFSPVIWLVPSHPKVDPKTGITTNSRGISVQLYDGKLESEDPEVQYYMENNAQVAWGEDGLKMWREIYLNDHQQSEIAKAEQAELLAANRKLREENSMLEQVKANTRKGQPASA